MSEFKIKVGTARQAKSDLDTCSKSLGTISGDIGRVKRSLRWKVQSRDLIENRLSTLIRDIDKNKSNISRFSSVLEQVINEYCATESGLVDSPYKKALQELLKNPLTYVALATLDPLTPISILDLTISNIPNVFDYMDEKSVTIIWNNNHENEDEDDSKIDLPKYQRSEDLNKKKSWSKELIETDDAAYLKTKDSDEDGKHSKIPEGSEKITDENELKKVKKEYEDFDKAKEQLTGAHTIYEKELFNDEYTFLEVKENHKIGMYSSESSTKIGNVEANASGSLTTTGVAGGFVASVCGFSAEETRMLGSDMLGVYVKGKVEALKAEAKAEAQAGLVEIDGKKVFAAHAGASAEVTLVEASAAVGGKVLGADVSGSVSGNVGFGAHADVGFQGGKIKFDVGASFGVGASADIEVDVSGAIDAACEHADQIANFVDNTVDNISDAFTDTLSSIGNLFGQ